MVTGIFGSNPCVSTVITFNVLTEYFSERKVGKIFEIFREHFFFFPLCAILNMSMRCNSFLVNGNATMVSFFSLLGLLFSKESEVAVALVACVTCVSTQKKLN